MEGVHSFLRRLGLDEHVEMFVAKGFDSEDDLPHIIEADLDVMYITNHKDRQLLLQAAQHYKPSKEHILFDWLRGKGLDHYFINFVQSEFVDLADIGRLSLPDEQLYDELEITLPGHKRRLERAVRSLAKRHKMTPLPLIVQLAATLQADKAGNIPPASSMETEMPVAYGRWGKPRCLVDAKYDFLILEATVVSTNDSRDRVHIEFMVDSGSDVVTLRQEVLDTMDLELIGPIHSKGVHGSKVKNLYKANILIGNQSIEIEVMGESYDSIGSRVIRHFRHYISGTHHIWLKGDYIDPTLPHKTHIRGNEEVTIPVQPLDKSENSSQLQYSGQTLDVEMTEAGVPNVRDNKSDIEENIDEDINDAEKELVVFDPHVQKDFVKVDGNTRNRIIEEIGEERHRENNDFKFTKEEHVATHVSEEINKAADEPDKILFKDDEIIDIRPIIAANRKRHVSNTTGVDPSVEDGIKSNRILTKKNKISLRNDSNLMETITDYVNGTGYARKPVTENLRTVLNQRSVYYRSQTKETDQQ